MKYEITFISGYTPITVETNEIIDKGDTYYFESEEEVRNKKVIFKYTVGKNDILNIKNNNVN